jgi:calcineurin-like phosphoesterase family protein
MGKIWMTSDLHFYHDKPFIYEPRGFETIYQMNEVIVKNWNDIVDEADDVYVLGDLMLNDNEAGLKLIKQLKGKIHIIRGNHDTATRIKLYEECSNVVEICEGKYFNYRSYHFFMSHYPCLTANDDKDKPLKAKVISLCGHTHTKSKFADMDKGMIYHVELDAHDNKPILLDDIIEDLKEFSNEK